MSNLFDSQPTHAVMEVTAGMITQPILPVVIEQTALHLFETFSEKLKASLHGQQEKALSIALNGNVRHRSARVFSVHSEDGQHAFLVNLDTGFCTCPDSRRGSACKHRLAAYLIEQANKANQSISPPLVSREKAVISEPVLAISDEESLEKARLVLHARSQYMRDSIVYAVLNQDDESLNVEIVDLEGEVATIRALPEYKDGQLIPQFPFPERKSVTQVLAKSLTNIVVYH
jgi:hypothetical protein